MTESKLNPLQWRPSTQRGKTWFASGLIIATGAGLCAVLFLTGPSNTPAAATEKSWPISTMVVEHKNIAPSFRAFGKVQSRSVATLATDLPAAVAEVSVKEGDLVDAGQILVSLDDSEFQLRVAEAAAELAEQQANYASAQAQLKHVQATQAQHTNMQKIAQAKLARHQQLMQERLISQSLFDEAVNSASQVSINYQRHQQQLAELPHRVAAAKAQVAKARALLKRAKLNLDKTKIIAPFRGPVLAVGAAIGNQVLPGTVLVTLADANAFELRVTIPEAYVGQFQKILAQPQPQPILGSSPAGQQYSLSRLAGAVSSGQSGVDAFFVLDSKQATNLPATGQVVELEITMPALSNVVAVPPQAIYDNNRIYAVINERLQPIPVRPLGEARDNNGQYQILVSAAQLANGQQIMTTQLPKAIKGLLVQSADSTQAHAIASGIQSNATPETDELSNSKQPRLPQHQKQAQPAVLEGGGHQDKPDGASTKAKRLPTLV